MLLTRWGQKRDGNVNSGNHFRQDLHEKGRLPLGTKYKLTFSRSILFPCFRLATRAPPTSYPHDDVTNSYKRELILSIKYDFISEYAVLIISKGGKLADPNNQMTPSIVIQWDTALSYPFLNSQSSGLIVHFR